eukprot:CAMPEP_0206845810 /NCGR_PEP_ID=MMETSP0975-20121206/24676_1 /ASSEMBLY_ACC=CAM_ASM_000399 /TAXON_ID=483370 /ORGANISM="non described non described, Strain CCMP2097" /LENGTH=38 /DNA_ID= /DNA_START= /DNA_END= /DNA_ORIENTATION=
MALRAAEECFACKTPGNHVREVNAPVEVWVKMSFAACT